MKTKIFISSLVSLLFASSYAQDRTTVNAMSSEISDNLDLRAVASIFGDSKNLEDFENRLNNPNNQISNLDLNNDNQVDYLRVIESVEGYSHIIVVQSVLGYDTYQDVASLEVERDANNRVSVQVVGDVYMYGANYIYEPVYVHTPIIYSYFWVPNYRPYCSTWYWGYYPSFYYAWNPFPIFRYRSHIGLYINFGHHYNYVTTRRCQVAYNNYYGRRANAYERQYPTRSFASRNGNVTNRHELDRSRNIRMVGDTRNGIADNGSRNNASRDNATRNSTSRNESSRGNSTTRDNNGPNTSPRSNEPRSEGNGNPRSSSAQRDNTNSSTSPRSNEPRTAGNGNGRSNSAQRDNSYTSPSPRNNEQRTAGNGNGRSYSAQRDNSYSSPSPRGNEQRTAGNDNGRSNSAQRDNSYGSPSPRNNESRNVRTESPRSNESRNSSAPRASEQRNSGPNNSQRGGGESRGQGRR